MDFRDPAWLEQERTCLAALRGGDRAAFGRLYDAFAQPLYARILMPKLGEPAAAEDALAETFRTAIERLDQYQDRGGSIWSWLVTIASNKAIDAQRERARAGRAMTGFEDMLAALGGPDDAAVPAAEAAVDRERLRQTVAGVLGDLNPRYRRALELRFLEDRERADCATALEVKVGTFDVLLLRALRSFRQRWQEMMKATELAVSR